jgi:hypothetical protein
VGAAAGCPCDGQQHCFAGTLIRISNSSSGSRGSRGECSSSSNSSRCDDVIDDLYGDMDTRSSWSSKPSKEVFVDSGDADALTELLLVVLAASVVIVAVAQQF